ncbi:cadherin-23, partial [Plakobranchus ocellatus]
LEAKDDLSGNTSTARVNVTINNVNDNSPEFESQPLSATVEENSVLGSSVIRVKAIDKDADDPINNFNKVTYYLEGANGVFDINVTSGEVSVADEGLDREKQELFFLTVIAEDGGGRKESQLLTIRVADKNDNAPVILSTQYQTYLVEDSIEMRNPVQIQASDADAAENSMIFYTLTATSPQGLLDYFSIDSENGSLSVLKPISYESIIFPEFQEGRIILTVNATDKGKIPLSTSVQIIIVIEDTNNNSPMCDHGIQNATIFENLASFPVINITAIDKDGTAPNNRFMFSLDEASINLFKIHSTTGEIKTRSGLDFEVAQQHQIEVTVTDLGTPAMSSTCQVIVQVSDKNDFPPEFDVHTIVRNTTEGLDFSYSCSATDVDHNPNLEFKIDWHLSTMHSSSQQNVPITKEIQKLIKIYEKNCTVHIYPLDRETCSKLDLILEVTDLNAEENTPQTDTAKLSILILDVNDEEPMFSNGPHYRATVRENMPDETPIKFENVTGISIVDKDADEINSMFAVKLLTHNSIFEVKPAEGTFAESFSILVLDSYKLDFEAVEKFDLKLEVTQLHSDQPFSNFAVVELHVTNENDNFPYFEKSSYEANIPENSTLDTLVTTVQAHDDDKGHFGQLWYSFKEKSNKFTIDAETGQVYFTAGSLDFESDQRTYSLAVSATDGGNLTTSTQLVLTVTDINDNIPEFLASTENERYIQEGQQFFNPSLIVQARDMDAFGSKNSKIVYSISDANDSLKRHFLINNETGEIGLSMPFNFETMDKDLDGLVSFIVVATDMGEPAQSASINISVIVTDVNDESPEFMNTSYFISVSENTPKDSYLLSVHAIDGDATGKNNRVTYSLDSASEGTFEIDPDSGAVKIIKILDREKIKSYNITITARDNGQPTNMNTAMVMVEVVDVNDTPPQFLENSMTLLLKEGWDAPLVNYSAYDQDLNYSLEYSIVWEESSGVNGAGNYMQGTELNPYIGIDSSTGQVSPKRQLDREQVQQFQLTLAVKDKLATSGDLQVDTALLKIVVEDENDNKPVFEGPNVVVAEVKETAQAGTSLTFVNLSSLIFVDADREGKNIYNITIEGDDFIISPSHGRGRTACSIYVKNTSILDYEENQNLTLVVKAIENAEHNSSVTITVLIQNENDNTPLFDSPSFTSCVPENATDGFYITMFVINGSTGVITLNSIDLDWERDPSYQITVRALDGGNLYTTTHLTINVIDVNDQSPMFVGTPYVLDIFEGSTDPQKPLLIKASDADQEGTKNSQVAYSIKGLFPLMVKMHHFNVDASTGELSIISPLDYEDLLSTSGKLFLKVEATDFGQPPLSSVTNITVRVLDRNDESPIFINKTYFASVKENSLAGEFVAFVEAYDDDGTQPNNEIYYVIETGGQDKFQMNSSSGQLVVGAGADLDRETAPSFTLTILAVDKGSPPRTGTASVLVSIEDVNDAKPILIKPEGELHTPENVSEGFVISVLTATDPDTNYNLEFSLMWEESQAFDEKDQRVNVTLVKDWFIINSTSGSLTVSSQLDRELVQQVLLKVLVTDTASIKDKAPQIDTAILNIAIDDVNDNAPVIASCDNGKQLYVSEAAKIGTEITTFLATDKDKEQNIVFSLNDKQSFTITSSGKLSLASALDRETQSTVNFTVIASDSGSPVQTSECDVQVIIEDANDNDPQFTTLQTNFTISEFAQKGRFVGHISATDKDEGGKGKVTFDFMDYSPFEIDDFGNITVDAKLDREKVEDYSLTVIASDNPENPVLERKRAATKLIHIYIQDENDQTPVFDIGNSISYTGVLSERKKFNDVLSIAPKQIFASDADIGHNAEIVYSLQSQDAVNTYFRIDSETGHVLVNRTNLHGLAGEYRYTVVATDKGNPPFNATVNLTVTVLDENINRPKFVKSGPIAAIPECIKPESSIYQFSATDDDKDKSTNGKVSYYLDTNTATDDYKFFSLDENLGILKTREKLDTEKNSKLQIQIQAKDNGDPRFTVLSGLLTIHISDINDNAPDFKHLSIEDTSFSVEEGSGGVGTQVGTIKAQDKDLNATLSYDLLGSKWANHFVIESDKDLGGIIKLQKALDREIVDKIELEVVATDFSQISAGAVCEDTNRPFNMESDPLTVTILIEDVNDSPPMFVVRSLYKGFLSSTEFGTEILSLPVYVNDKDTKENSIHKFYQLGDLMLNEELLKSYSTEEKTDPIRVDINGSVVTNFKFPENVFGQLTFKVLVNDSAGNDVISVNIYIVGDSQVVFLTFYLSENDLRKKQLEISQLLTDSLPYQIVPDNILPFRNPDGSVDGSKSVLVVHALDKSSNDVMTGRILLDAMDASRSVNMLLENFKVLKTETGEEANASTEKDDGRTQYILAAIIVLMTFAFLITLYLLLNNIQRFKRKLKAATIEVHAMGTMEQNQFPGLKDHIKSSNPVFMRDDISLDDLEDNASQHSYSSNNSRESLDQNEVVQSEENEPVISKDSLTDAPEHSQVEAEEQELYLDLYEGGQAGSEYRPHSNSDISYSSNNQPGSEIPQALQLLNAALAGEEDDEWKNGQHMQGNYVEGSKSTQKNSRCEKDEGWKKRQNPQKELGKLENTIGGQEQLTFGYHVESTEI